MMSVPETLMALRSIRPYRLLDAAHMNSVLFGFNLGRLVDIHFCTSSIHPVVENRKVAVSSGLEEAYN